MPLTISASIDNQIPQPLKQSSSSLWKTRLTINTDKRGEFFINNITISTLCLFGVLETQKTFPINQHYYVFPKPLIAQSNTNSSGKNESSAILSDDIDDYAGQRSYIPGDSFKHINWKAFAKTDALAVNQYSATETKKITWIDWNDFSHPDIEARLSQMVYLLIEKNKVGQQYGLSLPNITINPDNNPQHYLKCLIALTTFSPAASSTH